MPVRLKKCVGAANLGNDGIHGFYITNLECFGGANFIVGGNSHHFVGALHHYFFNLGFVVKGAGNANFVVNATDAGKANIHPQLFQQAHGFDAHGYLRAFEHPAASQYYFYHWVVHQGINHGYAGGNNRERDSGWQQARQFKSGGTAIH